MGVGNAELEHCLQGRQRGSEGEQFAAPMTVDAPDAGVHKNSRQTILVLERLEREIAYYEKPIERVPDEYRLYRTKDGRLIDVPFLGLACNFRESDTCVAVQMTSPEREWSRREIQRSDLTWLPETDLLGLPLGQGGRKPLSEEEEGHKIPRPDFPY